MIDKLDQFFNFSQKGSSFQKELMAGLTTFTTMAYILFVNPQVLSLTGMDFGAVMTATILASAFATLLMGLLANYPFALAPSMGLNAFFTYGVVLNQGVAWPSALGIVLVSGFIFLILNLLGIRQLVMESIPAPLRYATLGGMGILLAFIGLKNLNIIVAHPGTLISVGRISLEAFIAFISLSIMTILMTKKVRGAILYGILFSWVIGLIFALTSWKGFFSFPPSISPTWLKADIKGILNPIWIPTILSFVFVAVFDTAGTIISLAEQGHLLDERGKLPYAKRVLTCDALGTILGSLLGTSPIMTYLESSSGIAEGGKTGLTAVVVGCLFLLSLFISPLILSVPSFATASVLILIGALLFKTLAKINWNDPSDFIPAFTIVVTIPLTFSITTGMAAGFILYPLIKTGCGKFHEVHTPMWVVALLFTIKFIWA